MVEQFTVQHGTGWRHTFARRTWTERASQQIHAWASIVYAYGLNEEEICAIRREWCVLYVLCCGRNVHKGITNDNIQDHQELRGLVWYAVA